jgi:hypothetical protein
MPWIELLGYAASLTVFATFCMNTMVPLRVLALLSNILFSVYGAVGHIYPVMILHVILFPINAIRLVQIQRIVREVRNLEGTPISIETLLPFMQRRSLATGEMLMRKGDPADRVFYLAKGTVEITELGKAIEPGSIIGEIGIFSPHQKRTASAICRSDCSLYELSMSQVKRLYFQNPSFGYAVLQLIIVRLLENQDLMQRPAATT